MAFFFSTVKKFMGKYSHFSIYKTVDYLFSLKLLFLVNNTKVYFDNLLTTV